jgi:hypothetical protein
MTSGIPGRDITALRREYPLRIRSCTDIKDRFPVDKNVLKDDVIHVTTKLICHGVKELG